MVSSIYMDAFPPRDSYLMSTTTTTTLSQHETGSLNPIPEIPSTQPTPVPNCEAPIPVPPESAPGTICCHLNWQQDCPECHDSQPSKVAHLAELSPKFPVLYLPENCPPSVKPRLGEMEPRLDTTDIVVPTTETPSNGDSSASLSSVSLTTSSSSRSSPAASPGIACPQSVRRPYFTPEPLLVRPSSPDNLKNSTEMLQGLRIVEGNLQDLEGVRSTFPAVPDTEAEVDVTIPPPHDLGIAEPSSRIDLPPVPKASPSTSTETHTGLTPSEDAYADDKASALPDNPLDLERMSPSELAELAGKEARRALADTHAPGSILVQQFSSGDKPTCTIIMSRDEEDSHRHHHHHEHHDRHHHHGHHHHHHHHHRRSSSSSSSRSESRSRSRTPPAPIVITQDSTYPYNPNHPQYVPTYPLSPRRTITGPIYRSRSPSPPTIIQSPEVPLPSIVRVPPNTESLHSDSHSDVMEMSPRQRPVSSGSTPPQVLSPLPAIFQGENGVPAGVGVPDSKNTSHSALPLYRPLSPSFIRHDKFYFEDGSAVFRIGIVLYKIHRHFFDLHSVFFHELFSALKLTERFTTAEPIVLSDVKNEDFERLLSLFYPTKYTELDLRTTEEWTSVLILATKYTFPDLRTLAIKHLTPILPPLDQVILGAKYQVTEWILPGIKHFVIREEPLNVREGEELGTDVVVKIGQVRSELGSVYGEECVGDTDQRKGDFVDLRIKEVFDL